MSDRLYLFHIADSPVNPSLQSGVIGKHLKGGNSSEGLRTLIKERGEGEFDGFREIGLSPQIAGGFLGLLEEFHLVWGMGKSWTRLTGFRQTPSL